MWAPAKPAGCVRKDPALEPTEGGSPAHAWISDFWPPACGITDFCFKPSSLGSLVEATLGCSQAPARVSSRSHEVQCRLSSSGPSASPPTTGDQTTLPGCPISLEPPPASLDSCLSPPSWTPAQPALTKGVFSVGHPPLPSREGASPRSVPGAILSQTLSATAHVPLHSI